MLSGQCASGWTMASKMAGLGTQACSNSAAVMPEAAQKRKEVDEFVDGNDITKIFLIPLSKMPQEDPKTRARRY